jgi:hypothetical protein
MRANNFLVASALLFAAATVVVAAGQSSSPISPSLSSGPAQHQSPEAPPRQQAPKPGSVLQITTRLLTVDIVATDSRAAPGSRQTLDRSCTRDESAGRGRGASTAGQCRLCGLHSDKISVSERECAVASIRRRVHGILQAPHHHPAHLFRLPVIFSPNAASHSEAQRALGFGLSRARIACNVLLSPHRIDDTSEPPGKCRPWSMDKLDGSHDGKTHLNVMDNELGY